MRLLPTQIEIVYNNGGYIAATQEDAYYNVFADNEPADTLQTFQKPPGRVFACSFIQPRRQTLPQLHGV